MRSVFVSRSAAWQQVAVERSGITSTYLPLSREITADVVTLNLRAYCHSPDLSATAAFLFRRRASCPTYVSFERDLLNCLERRHCVAISVCDNCLKYRLMCGPGLLVEGARYHLMLTASCMEQQEKVLRFNKTGRGPREKPRPWHVFVSRDVAFSSHTVDLCCSQRRRSCEITGKKETNSPRLL